MLWIQQDKNVRKINLEDLKNNGSLGERNTDNEPEIERKKSSEKNLQLTNKSNRVDDAVEILQLGKRKVFIYGPTLFAEKLVNSYKIHLSRGTIKICQNKNKICFEIIKI